MPHNDRHERAGHAGGLWCWVQYVGGDTVGGPYDYRQARELMRQMRSAGHDVELRIVHVCAGDRKSHHRGRQSRRPLLSPRRAPRVSACLRWPARTSESATAGRQCPAAVPGHRYTRVPDRGGRKRDRGPSQRVSNRECLPRWSQDGRIRAQPPTRCGPVCSSSALSIAQNIQLSSACQTRDGVSQQRTA